MHRDDGSCHRGCFERAVIGDSEYGFIRSAYLDIAAEFDPSAEGLGMPRAKLENIDNEYIVGAKEFAVLMGIPLPWNVRSLDRAAALVERAERREV